MKTTTISFSLLLAVAACSSSQTTPTEPTSEPATSATSEPTSAPTAAPTAEPIATTAPTAAPTAEPVSEPMSDTPPPSGRPAATYEKADKLTETVGASPATNLKLSSEGASLRVPEWALGEGVLVGFWIEKKAIRKAKGGAGSVYRLQGQRPPAEEFSTVVSRGPKFLVKLPTAKVASPNLAVGEAKKDAKGKDTVEWKVVAPKSTEGGFATFELSEFTDSILQITSESPK